MTEDFNAKDVQKFHAEAVQTGSLLDARGATDDNKDVLNRSLHGEQMSNAIETHLKAIGSVDTVPTQDTMQAARMYAEYKNGLIKDVFDAKTGQVRADAPTEKIQALYDLSNREVSATRSFIASGMKKGDDILAVASFQETGNYLPKTMRETQS